MVSFFREIDFSPSSKEAQVNRGYGVRPPVRNSGGGAFSNVVAAAPVMPPATSHPECDYEILVECPRTVSCVL